VGWDQGHFSLKIERSKFFQERLSPQIEERTDP
jgi:hypothetical protein